tara:strand:- start:11847 stop:12035 length:189 start_codon:yes stop_codon:yes gene_type:complete
MNEKQPILLPQIIVEFATILAPLAINVVTYYDFLSIEALGLITLIKTALEPMKTSSSTLTPA